MPVLSTLTTTQTVTLSVLNTNQTVTPFAPITATGGTPPLVYSINPSIFSGLNFNTATGEISGTPTTLTDDISYEITVVDSGVGPDAQSAARPFRLAVVNKLLTSVDIKNASLTATVPSAPFIPVTSTGGYGTKTWSISPTLPEGLHFNFVTGSISNAARLGNTTTQYSITTRDAANFTSTGTFALTILPFKEVLTAYPWETTGTIGTIVPGEISELYVKGQFSTSSLYLNYSLTNGALPAGLTLNKDGTISGRAVANPGLTNVVLTSTCVISVTDTNNNNLLNGRFSINVNQSENIQYTEIYCRPFLSQIKRSEFAEFVKNDEIFIPNLLYRPLDPNFGKQEDLKLVINFGVKQLPLRDYVDVISTNFYRRKISLGALKTAVARNADGTVKHEIIYVDIIDKHVNSSKVSIPNEITFNGNTYYLPSIINMQAKFVNDVVTTNIRNPSFTNFVQADGSVSLGYIPFVPLCFALPGKSATIIRKITESGFKFNTFNFEIDRIIVEQAADQAGAKYLLLNRSSRLA
jgi:hypothetical protein